MHERRLAPVREIELFGESFVMSKESIISTINFFEYFGCNDDLKSSLSDYYVKNNDCRILLATNDSGEQVGLLLYEEKTVVEILYVKAKDGFCKKELLKHLIDLTDKMIRYRIVSNEEDEKIALDCGFFCESSLNIYHSFDWNHPGTPGFFEKYNKLYLFAIKRNCTVKSFAELNEDELRQIRDNPDDEFVSELQPGKFLGNNFNDLSKRVSTAVIKNGKVAAYSLVRCVGNKCIFEILCVAKSHRRTTVIAPAFIRSLREIYNEGLTRITYAVYQKNTEMIKVLENNMKETIESVTVQHNMIYNKGRH